MNIQIARELHSPEEIIAEVKRPCKRGSCDAGLQGGEACQE
jgi:hypothetical protein